MRFSTVGSVRRRRAAAATVAAAAMLGCTSGCGTASDTAAEVDLTPAQSVSRAARTTLGLTSLRYRVTGTLPGHGKVRAEASMGVRPSVMRMKITGLGATEGKPLQIRFAGGAMYTEGDTAALGDAGGKRWLKAEPAVWGRGSAYNQTYRVVPRQLEGSPLVQSTILSGAEDIREAGSGTVDGTPTTHYRGEVTGKGLRAYQSAAKGKKAHKLRTDCFDQFMALGLKVGSALTMDLWVDEDGRAKQFRMRGRTNALDGKGRWVDTGPLDMTVTFLDANPSVTVEPPAADDTVDLAELADGAAPRG
ncbi:hypothetical protein ACIQVC_38365 [Streptomyces sp. NPDC101112]|uniref:hypothetical protein n=1 Tax=Streptomyces sp. NPDC101112 TaxID=3366105 RepID=UPI00382BA86D